MKIKGIFLELSYVDAGISTIDEIREALLSFKESGKFIYTYSDELTQGAYYLASVSDKIYINPAGGLVFKGLRTNVIFYKNAMEKLGIEPVIFRHGKFKSALNPLCSIK
jgi:protease-4